MISEWIIHTRDNWELPKLLFVVQASYGKTFNMESMNTRKWKQTWLPSPDSLCVALYVPSPLLVSLRVNEHDDDDDISDSSYCISLPYIVLCTRSFTYTIHMLSHLILIMSLWAPLSSPFLSWGSWGLDWLRNLPMMLSVKLSIQSLGSYRRALTFPTYWTHETTEWK